MGLTKLHGELTQCCLAEALLHVLERAATCQVDRYILISVGDTTIAEQGAVLSKLVNGFLRQNEGLISNNLIGDDYYTHADNVDELKLPLDQIASRILVVAYAPCKDEIAVQLVEEMTSKLRHSSKRSILLTLCNPVGLLGLKPDNRAIADLRMYHLSRIGKVESDSDWETNLKFIGQPLDFLQDQCGWHFVMECVRWISGPVEGTTALNGTCGAAMFSTINQLPFQLLLLIFRWSHFHPELVRAGAKKLWKQTQLIPQARVRHEIAALQRREEQIWRGLYQSAEQMEETTVFTKQEPTLSPLCLKSSSPQELSRKFARLSECCLWDSQKQFYKDQGIRAWSSGKIPFGVSSSSFLASSYARIVVDFLLSNADYVKPSIRKKNSPNCFVWEAASGSCKFLHSFMLHFTELVDSSDEFKKRGLVPLVVATDLSEQVLNSRRQMSCFRQFIERGQLDFALFDTYEFIHGNPQVSGKRKTLELVHSQRQWNVGSDGPVALMGNYFLDSLRADIFTVAVQLGNEADLNVNRQRKRIIVQEALLDKDTSSIVNMNVILRPVVDPRVQSVYEDERLNTVLVEIVDQFHSRTGTSSTLEPVSSTGLILFPVEAFEFLLTLFDNNGEADAFPIVILAGDARFSFRDAISSAFITTSTVETSTGATEPVGLELPQLSPHPDCFCLPVDFEIFELFFNHLNCKNVGISASSQLVSAPASDTFDVFFATVGKDTTKSETLHTSFKHQFARFTPGDCDLLWGMMSFDDGARCFSMDALLALLAQTGWDFDLFSVLHWELLNRWKKQTQSEATQYRHILIEAGVMSWRTFYHMEHQSETDGTTRVIRLQLARWFYELEAYDNVLDILKPRSNDPHKSSSDVDDVDVFYLLGLTNLRKDEYWTALSYFRCCVRLAPTKMKFQRQVANTLLALQTLKTSSNSSNEAT
ncbi:hypothetical protein F441_22883 [Phytophthora nicotianae CJ01A1]|uniref:Uncharacterized protein n=1 Tax=Phytophthora nicotianae CJ01A1 TaxID=1317063 RepID=W2VQP7_PHYNI|nr:hypothetical protein F441_22883 [Phytophthora nicotianae CJ01A1]